MRYLKVNIEEFPKTFGFLQLTFLEDSFKYDNIT